MVAAAQPPRPERAGRRGPTSGSIPPTPACSTRPAAMPALVRVLHVLHGSLMIPGVGRTDRRLGRRLHVRLLPDRPLAVVADHRQRPARLPLEAAEFDQRQSPPPDGLLDPAAAGDAVASPASGSPSRSVVRPFEATPAQGRRRRSGPRPGDAGPTARADGDDRGRGAGRRAAARDRAAGRDRLADRPGAASGRSPSRAKAARPRSRSPTPSGEVTPPRPPRPETRARTMRRWHDGTGMGLVWQIDHLHRRHHPGGALDHRHRHVAAQPRLAREAASASARRGASRCRSRPSDARRRPSSRPRRTSAAGWRRTTTRRPSCWSASGRRRAASPRSTGRRRATRRSASAGSTASASRSARTATRSASRRAARAASGARSMSPATRR